MEENRIPIKELLERDANEILMLSIVTSINGRKEFKSSHYRFTFDKYGLYVDSLFSTYDDNRYFILYSAVIGYVLKPF